MSSMVTIYANGQRGGVFRTVAGRFCTSATRLFGLACVALLLFLLPTRADAQYTYWNVQSGDWSVYSNWTGGLPSGSAIAFIDNGGTATVTQSGATCAYLELGHLVNDVGTVQMTSGSLWTLNNEYIGLNGTGTFTQSGGTNSASQLILGYGSSDSGAYTLTGGVCLAGTADFATTTPRKM